VGSGGRRELEHRFLCPFGEMTREQTCQGAAGGEEGN